jgi:hypothetical protein
MGHVGDMGNFIQISIRSLYEEFYDRNIEINRVSSIERFQSKILWQRIFRLNIIRQRLSTNKMKEKTCSASTQE